MAECTENGQLGAGCTLLAARRCPGGTARAAELCEQRPQGEGESNLAPHSFCHAPHEILNVSLHCCVHLLR